MMGRNVAALLALAMTAFALAACGGGSDSSEETRTKSVSEAGRGGNDQSGTDAGNALRIEADPNGAFAYTATELAAAAGKVTIDFSNPSAAAHDVRIEDSSGKDIGGVDVISEGTDSSTAVLKPGQYTFYCSLEGHRQAGMEGTLKVE